MEQQSCKIIHNRKNQRKMTNYMEQTTLHQTNKNVPKKSKYNATKKQKSEDSSNVLLQYGQSEYPQQTSYNQIQISQNQNITEDYNNTINKYSKNNLKLNNDDSKFNYEVQDEPSAKNSLAKSQLNHSNHFFQSQVLFKKQKKYNEQTYQSPKANSEYSLNQNNNFNEKKTINIRKSVDVSVFSSRFSKINADYDYVQELELLQEKNKEENSNKILSGLEPLFLEMQIIKNAFQDLEGLINYQIDSMNQNSKDIVNTLFHFSKAKKIFQQLRNQIGLSRCYFNLGIIYVLLHEYNLAQEYFESSILISLEILGLDYSSLINQKVILKQEEDSENQITILCKRILSKAYSFKQQALKYIYLEENEQMNDICDFHNQKVILQMRINQHKINYLLKNSIDSYTVVEQIVFNNNLSFSEVFVVFLYQEILEVCIFLGNTLKALQYTDKINTLFDQQGYLGFIFQSIYQNSNSNKNQQQPKQIQDESFQNKMRSYSLGEKTQPNFIYQIKEIQKSRQKYLLGLIESKKQNFYQAFELFTEAIEDGSHYNPSLRRKVINQLNFLLKLKLNKQIDLQKLYLDQEACTSYDITLIIQMEYLNQYSSFDICIKNLQDQNFFKPGDRIQLLIYQSQLDVLIPFTKITSNHQLNLLIKSIREISNEKFYISQEKQQDINWIQAIEMFINEIQEYKCKDFFNNKKIINSVKQGFQKFMEYKTQKIKQNMNEQQRKKIIILFSKQENCQIQNLKINGAFKLLNQQKLNIYHLKEYSYKEKPIQLFSNPFLNYESYRDDVQFINRFKKFREEDSFNEENEFIAILNNS